MQRISIVGQVKTPVDTSRGCVGLGPGQRAAKSIRPWIEWKEPTEVL